MHSIQYVHKWATMFSRFLFSLVAVCFVTDDCMLVKLIGDCSVPDMCFVTYYW